MLKKMTRAALFVVAFGAVLPAQAGGVPTVDIIGNAQELAHWKEKLQQWKETALHYKDQIQAYKDQLATQTGLRDIQGLVEQGKSLKNDILDLQKQGISLNDLLTSDSAPSGALDKLYSKYKDFDVCDPQAAKSYLAICKQETVNKAYMVEQTVEVQKKVNKALDEIGRLSDRIASAKDSKESMDLANAIQAKSVQLNTLTSAWEMNNKAAEQRDKLLEQKREKAFYQQLYDAPIPHFGDF